MPQQLRKVLIANRGEIAVRIIRACHDAGIESVAVYSQQDRDAPFARLADEAYSLDGSVPSDTYLDSGKLIAAAQRAGADSVHPGYGFLAENADFAQAVIDAGLVWIGPPPSAIEALGDKVSARRIAEKVGAPLAPGTKEPVSTAQEIIDFAEEVGLPVAIKAAFGGGGRGLKVVRSIAEAEPLFESAQREAVAAFGRGECFVEKFLDRPRHVETQCLADQHGAVTVISTRDCTLQRRHQKLVEEAPAPFLTQAQEQRLYDASKAILREAGYVGAGTCEFLLGADGTLSFLEVNTRLQVEHCVSEEVTGIDLVREMFRIASGERLGYDDPPIHGHAIEFRINAEDPARDFAPATGTLTRWSPPQGPGVRVDSGYEDGQTVPPVFDSLIAKLIVTGSDRAQAIERSRRALSEFAVEGLPTVVPFHRAILSESAFTGRSGPQEEDSFEVFTTWIDSEFTPAVPPTPIAIDPSAAAADASDATTLQRRTVTIEVAGKRLDVVLPAELGTPTPTSKSGRQGRSRTTTNRDVPTAGSAAASPDALLAGMQGAVVNVSVQSGSRVTTGDTVVVLEAMKLEQPIRAHRDGTVSNLEVSVGTAVSSDSVICEITD